MICTLGKFIIPADFLLSYILSEAGSAEPASCSAPSMGAYRSAKDGARSSPHYGGEGAIGPPIAPRCADGMVRKMT